MNAPTVLVVDDDARHQSLLDRYLTSQGFSVAVAHDGARMNEVLGKQACDLIVLDIMLPGEDGLAICSRLRASGNDLPIIMLTAKGDDVDRIIGLEIGADDYLAKPFNPRELVARIRAVLRRRAERPPSAPVPGSAPITFGEFELDLARRELRRAGTRLDLTSGEFAVLKVLVTHAAQPLSREVLMRLALGRTYEAYDRSIDVKVSRLRQLLEQDPSRPRFIQTVWGHGYVFILDGTKA